MAYDSITELPAGQALATAHQPVHAAIKANLEAVQSGLGVVSNTPTADKVLAGTGTGTAAWTATPTLTGLTLGTAERSLVVGEGTELWWFSSEAKTRGTVASLSKGTMAAPDTSARPMVKLNQIIEVTDAGSVTGDGAEELSVINATIDSTASTVRQPIAVFGQARTRSTVAPYGADATAGYFRGDSMGYGRGIGLFAGGSASHENAAADGMQLVVWNSTGTNHAVHPTGISTTTGMWLCPGGTNDQRCGVGIQIGNGFGAQFDVAVEVNGQTTASPTATVQTASVANPTVITTTAAHGLLDGDQVVITGSNSTPTIDGTYTATVTGTTTFTIPVNVTVQGTAGSIIGRIGAALTAAFRDDSHAKSSLQVRGSHSVAAVNLSESSGGLSIWLPRYDASTNNGVIAATNVAGNGTTRLAYYTSAGVLNLGAESSIASGAFHTFTTGGIGVGNSTTTGVRAVNVAGNGYVRALDYNSSGVLTLGAGAENTIASAVLHTFTTAGIGLGKDTLSGIKAVNGAGNGYVRMLDYDGSLLTLGAGAEAVASPGIYSAKYHSFGAGIYIGAGDITTDTTTGTKIGTSTSQKLGFFGATPIAKPTGVAVSAAGIHAALVSLGLIAA